MRKCSRDGNAALTMNWQTFTRHLSEVFRGVLGGGTEAEGEESERWSWRPRHGDGSPTCCSSPAMLNSPSELMSHTSCLPFSFFLSYLLLLHHPAPFSISWFRHSLSRCSFFTSFQLVPVSVSLWPLSPSTSLLISLPPCAFWPSPLSVCQNQAREPWQCHTNKVRGSVSVSRGDTFINDRSTRPCWCSITSAGACPWGAQHVRCLSKCVRACVRVLLPPWVLQHPGLRWS